MKLTVNGEPRQLLADSVSLADLLKELGIKAPSVVIELNSKLVDKKSYSSTILSHGDTLEIVRFVGGGGASKAKPLKGHGAAKNLVIVESPTKAKTIHKILGRGYQVEASMGHVRDLPKSKMGVDIEAGFKPHYIVRSKARKTVNRLKKTATGKKAVYLAPDPDREGEAISWHLATLLKDCGGEIRRVVFNEITKEKVQEAFQNPRAIDLNLVNAQQARRIMDRIVGYNLSPLLWRKVGSGLSAGRVQSVALRLIVEREKEIAAFKPKEYWTLDAELSSKRKEAAHRKFMARLDRVKGEKLEIPNEKEALRLKGIIQKEIFRVLSVEEKEKKRSPGAPFTTSKMQQEAFSRLGFHAGKTMMIAQRLYEGIDLGPEGIVGLITYMRTDSVNVAQSAVQEVRKLIRDRFGSKYLPPSPRHYKSRKGAQEAHEAIRPTSVARDPERVAKYLAPDELKLYDLIWRKFVASQMSDANDRVTTVKVLAGKDYLFRASGTTNLFPGFLAAYGAPEKRKNARAEKEGEEEELPPQRELPGLVKGEELHLHGISCDQHFTKPPSRYNDASLVKTLEEKGIGRPSTYAPTIYILVARSYIERSGGALKPTELGELVIELLVKHFASILDYDFTANMEDELDKVEEGSLEWAKVIRDFYGPFVVDLEEAKKTMEHMKQPVETEHVCDVCGKKMVIRMGRFGKFMACSGFPACRYTRSLPTGFRCPNEGCGGELVKRRSRKGRTFYGCSNYPRCTYAVNHLPKAAVPATEEEKPPEADELDPHV